MDYTRAKLLTMSRSLLNETTASFWTDLNLVALIDEAVRVMAERSGCYRTTQIVYTVATNRLVSFVGYKCIAVEYANKALIKITPLQAGHAKLDGVTPQFWFEHSNTIGIEPVPSEVYALTLYTIGTPYPMTEATDTPIIPYALHGLIPFYVVSKALEQDRKTAEARQYMSMFHNELEYMSKNILLNIPDGIEDLRFR